MHSIRECIALGVEWQKPETEALCYHSLFQRAREVCGARACERVIPRVGSFEEPVQMHDSRLKAGHFGLLQNPL